MQRILPPTFVAGLLIAMIAAAIVSPWPDSGWPVRLVGAAVVAVGLVINVRHAKLFDQLGTNIRTFDDPDMLVQDGAFAWTRNPMYLGFLLLLVGVALGLGSAVALIGPMLFFGAADRWYIPFEEQRMAATFGTDYDNYQRQVRRWIGRRSS